MSAGAFDVSMQVFEKAAEVFSLLSTPARLRIVDELCRNELNVAQLKQRVGVAQPNLSQHLGLLYRAGLVARRREGSQVFYRVNAETVPLLCVAVRSLLPCPAAPWGPSQISKENP